MDYLTNYYRNLSEQLQQRVNFLQNLLEQNTPPNTESKPVYANPASLSPEEKSFIMATSGDNFDIAKKLANLADHYKSQYKDQKDYNVLKDAQFVKYATEYADAASKGKRAEDEVGYDTDDTAIREPEKSLKQRLRDEYERAREKGLPGPPSPF